MPWTREAAALDHGEDTFSGLSSVVKIRRREVAGKRCCGSDADLASPDRTRATSVHVCPFQKLTSICAGVVTLPEPKRDMYPPQLAMSVAARSSHIVASHPFGCEVLHRWGNESRRSGVTGLGIPRVTSNHSPKPFHRIKTIVRNPTILPLTSLCEPAASEADDPGFRSVLVSPLDTAARADLERRIHAALTPRRIRRKVAADATVRFTSPEH